MGVAMRAVLRRRPATGDGARLFRGQRDHGARDALNRPDRGFGAGAHGLHVLGPVRIDHDGEKRLAVAKGEAGDRAGIREWGPAIRAGDLRQRRHNLVARRHPCVPLPAA